MESLLTLANNSDELTSHHADLLQTVSDLRSQLERTVERIQGLEIENERLRNTELELSVQLRDLKGDHDNIKVSYLRALSDKIDQETQFEEFITRVKNQLAEKTKEFELLREKFAPQDIDYIRIKLSEDIELRYVDKLQHMNDDLEFNRNLSAVARRDIERMKAESDLYRENITRENTAVKAEYEKLLQRARDEIKELQGQVQVADEAVLLRKANLEIVELRSLTQTLRSDLSRYQQERDQAVTALENTRSSFEEYKLQSRSSLVIAESLRIKSELSLKSLQGDITVLRNEVTQMRQEKDSLLTDLESRSLQLKSMEQRMQEFQDEYSNTIRDANIISASEQQKLLTEITKLNEITQTLEDNYRRSQREASEAQSHAEKVELDLRKFYQADIQKLVNRITQLESIATASENQIAALTRQLNQLNEHAQVEGELYRNDLARLQREKSALLGKLHQLSVIGKEANVNLRASIN